MVCLSLALISSAWHGSVQLGIDQLSLAWIVSAWHGSAQLAMAFTLELNLARSVTTLREFCADLGQSWWPGFPRRSRICKQNQNIISKYQKFVSDLVLMT
jgi:hypothetical protein